MDVKEALEWADEYSVDKYPYPDETMKACHTLAKAVRELQEKNVGLRTEMVGYAHFSALETALRRAEAAEAKVENLEHINESIQIEAARVRSMPTEAVKERDELRAENEKLRRAGEELADQSQIVMGCEFGSGEMIMQFCELTEKVRQFRALDAGEEE